MDTNDAKEVFKYLDTILAKEFTLRREKTAKPVLGADDFILLFIYYWAWDISIFPTEDQRLALATILLLLIYTGCRPAELVDAGKVKSAIDRDQTYEDDNWDEEYEGLDKTKHDDPIYENPEPWVDPKVSDCDDQDDEEVLTREYKALCYEDIRLWIVRNPTPGERDLLGMEITLAHYKGADRKPKPAFLSRRAASTTVRDQVMRYNSQTGVFCGSYINEKVRFIVQDAVLDQPTNVGFLCAFTHMSLTCDPRAPIDVPEEVLKALPPDPEIMELTREREEYKRQYGSYSRAPLAIRKECEQLRRQIDSLQKQRDRAIKIEFRRDYFDRIHDEELKRQLKKVPTNEYVEPIVHHQLPERTRLQEVLCDLSRDLSPSDIVSRRIRAIDLMIALSYRQEQEVLYSNRSSRVSSVSSESSKDKLFKDKPSKDQFLYKDFFLFVCKKI
ncbi:hypothetical protein DSL72_001413 [Monilinia vaccinii-corymbosi]|uniref:FluG domain-containing protein n=1 Tax=Monilinia vaccinii-corymbosi TaxID=61207 RepID=A0A8A3P5X6_9HELO|nr:hypothetical protein DSL72_001413 [Monilinia vaccinii-corymbosi]